MIFILFSWGSGADKHWLALGATVEESELGKVLKFIGVGGVNFGPGSTHRWR